ncbi:MAG: TonB-dependent receptor plug domain-containing protein [Opitutales bacterium]|nr:TonB-dependent receptor plug domain-containing protein [Opitutales bacterium]
MWKKFTLASTAILAFCSSALLFAQSEEESEEKIFELSPFEVVTEGDRGYYASNTISGSRINIALQDVPMPIEVITSEFIEDTGSVDLRESLRYSAGVILDSQNDAGANLTGVPGGVHNGAGATANITNTTIKLRGFVTESSLRAGFRRQHGSDSINIDRVEVVRGPNSLLYGIGNFGGIVNYLPKRPLETASTSTAVMIGNDSFYRATLDDTRPINDQLSYRFTAAYEQADHYTDFQERDKWFLSPVFVYKPFEKTKVTFDFEIGSEKTSGIGFNLLRARADLNLNDSVSQQGRLQKANFPTFPGVDPRTFRLSGPDTFVETDAHNMLIEVEQTLMDGLVVRAGVNMAESDVSLRDVVNAAYVRGDGPENLRGTINVPAFEGGSFDAEIGNGNQVVTDSILTYAWRDTEIEQKRDEVKLEAVYTMNLFEESRWLGMSGMFLLGFSDLRAERGEKQYTSAGGDLSKQLFKDPNDLTPIRFGQGIQDDGTPNGVAAFSPLELSLQTHSIAYNQGYYGVFQGQFLEDRVTLIYGQRKDRNDLAITDFTVVDGVVTDTSENPNDAQSQNTTQLGISVELLPGFNVFALKAEGLEPNFQGLRDGNGNAIAATFAESEEIGIKLKLFDGRVALQGSVYEINVSGASSLPAWWTPAPAKGRYNPNQPTVYNLSGGVIGDFNAAWVANQDLWDAAIANGDAFYQDGNPYVTVLDANGNDTAAGAAFMDAMYAWAANGNGWPGWMFAGSQGSDGVSNNAAQDWGSSEGNSFASSLVSEEKSKGIDIQMMFTPLDNWQIAFNYAYTRREIVSPGTFPQYPYPQDRWAIWYFPDGNWGLQGVPLNLAYGDPQDTSTWTGGPASTAGEALDDTPAHDYGFWTAYEIEDGLLAGLKIGFGGDYQTKRAYLTGFTVDGDAVTDSTGQRISLFTDSKLLLNCMFRYDTEWNERPVYVQLNIDNLTDDEDLYGYVYESGMSWRLQAGITF